MYPGLALFALGATLPVLAMGQRLTQTSISDAQASALAAPLSSYIAHIEASPSFGKIVSEIAQSTVRPDTVLGKTAPSAAEFPTLAEALNAVAAKDPSVVGGLPADAQQFLADAAQGEIAVILSVLANNGGGAAGTASGAAPVGSFAGVYTAATAPASASAAMPSNWASGNGNQSNASGIVAPAPSAATTGTRISTGGAAAAATIGTGALGFVVAMWAAFM